ncbi:glycosyltransferase family 1 protein [Arthrobacter sp. ISL-69]|uniref:glycosyltransferase family 4 protein n=1 Tax=Arthrobacter sp. ISL-69 TaxID=2819113 RepID=UPI001BEB18C4|nr:glycosyltransferase family 1 protein [Arthrobacter sp. ISL-69]MBT2538272.1 glycosyltransferase family 4 protein [Arthrobacter sp. ISL-69]
MKILFDAYWSTDGPPSGRMVVTETIREWEKQFPQDQLLALVRDTSNSSQLPANVAVVKTRLRPHALAVSTLRRLATRTGADAVITQNFAVKGRNSCVFMHDAIFQSNPEFFTPSERAYFRLITASLPQATTVFTSSQNEAARILRHNAKLKDVRAVGLAVGNELLGAESVRPGSVADLDGFVLAVGRLNIRKNLATVFDAVNCSTRFSTRFPLVVVGERDGKMKDLSEDVRRLVAKGHIRFLGGVPNSQLRWLYEHAAAMIFASLDEGYGLPPLEAQHFGCPVVLSDIPVFRELYSEFATFAAPLSPHDIAAKLDEVLESGRRSSDRKLKATPSWEGVVSAMRKQILESWTSK